VFEKRKRATPCKPPPKEMPSYGTIGKEGVEYCVLSKRGKEGGERRNIFS